MKIVSIKSMELSISINSFVIFAFLAAIAVEADDQKNDTENQWTKLSLTFLHTYINAND